MLDRHSIVFNGMMNRLHVDRSVDFRQGFNEIAQELFKDDVTWSKIVAFFAFGAKLGQVDMSKITCFQLIVDGYVIVNQTV